jgi:hypothetical protein
MMVVVRLKPDFAIVLYVALPAGVLKSDREGCEAEERVSAGCLVSGTSGNQVP